MPVAPLAWMKALRAGKPPDARAYAVLDGLALAIDRDGTGWVPVQRLADEHGVNRTKVSQYLRWAMDAGWLVRTQRGHHITGGKARASSYALTIPDDVGEPGERHQGGDVGTSSERHQGGDIGESREGSRIARESPSQRHQNEEPTSPKREANVIDGGTLPAPNTPAPIYTRPDTFADAKASAGLASGESVKTAYDAPIDDDEADDLFDIFWDQFPKTSRTRRVPKQATREAWHDALARGHDAGLILTAATRYRRDKTRDPEFTLGAQRWLDDERFLDDTENGS